MSLLEAIYADIRRHAGGCWRWTAVEPQCSLIQLFAELAGQPLASGRLYRMPECELGRQCVNPDHLGSAEEWLVRRTGFRREQ